MSDIKVTPLAPGRYGVEVREGTITTTHEVAVPDGLLEELGLLEVGPLTVVEASFAFLLEREPATSILGDFSIDQIARYFPDYYDELRARLGA